MIWKVYCHNSILLNRPFTDSHHLVYAGVDVFRHIGHTLAQAITNFFLDARQIGNC